MIWSTREQITLVLQSVLFGAAAGLYYDLLRAVRRYFQLGRAKTALCDVAFWLLVLAGLFEFNLVLAVGQDRYYVLAGAAGGAAVYFATLSGLVLALLHLLFAAVGKAVSCLKTAAIWLCQKMQYPELLEKMSPFSKKFSKPSSIFRRKGLK